MGRRSDSNARHERGTSLGSAARGRRRIGGGTTESPPSDSAELGSPSEKNPRKRTEARAAPGRAGAPAVDDRAPARTRSPSSAPTRASLGVDRVAVVARAPLPGGRYGEKTSPSRLRARAGRPSARVRRRGVAALVGDARRRRHRDTAVRRGARSGASTVAAPRRAGVRGWRTRRRQASRRPRGGSPHRRRWALVARRATAGGVGRGPLQDTHLEKLHHGSFPVVHVRTARE